MGTTALRLDVTLAPGGRALRVTVHNTGTRTLRLWQRDTPWGHGMFSLRLQPPGEAAVSLQAAPKRFTRSLPRTLAVASGTHLDFELPHGDPLWQGWPSDAGWLQQALPLQVDLQIEDEAEAQAHGLTCGRWRSAPMVSPPPHAWLTGR